MDSLFICCILLLTQSPTHYYQWTDENGVVHFSLLPPKNTPSEQKSLDAPRLNIPKEPVFVPNKKKKKKTYPHDLNARKKHASVECRWLWGMTQDLTSDYNKQKKLKGNASSSNQRLSRLYKQLERFKKEYKDKRCAQDVKP